MSGQLTNKVIMIEPVAFGFNPQTAVNNYFQQESKKSDLLIQQLALKEFRLMVKLLRDKGVQVMVYPDTAEPHTPDSIFPNNWISFHEDGRVVLYPMYAPNRRAERRTDFIRDVMGDRFNTDFIVDYSEYEQKYIFLEGTGSMVLDHDHQFAYAALSERTDKKLFQRFCKDFGYLPICFSAFQQVGNERLPVYHTNVLMCVADVFVVICFDSIDDERERDMLKTSFRETGKDIIEINETQMHRFAGNMLQVKNTIGEKFLVMSQSAYDSLNENQIAVLRSYNDLIICSIPTIEKHGGGSVRCMMLEVATIDNIKI
jgi:hypothetical protein